MLGQDGSAKLAKAMLSDILLSLVRCSTIGMKEHQVLLYYGPGTEEGRLYMQNLLHDLGIADDVDLFPMLPTTNLLDQDLGDQLSHAFFEAQRRIDHGNVMFLGMDAPELPIEELEEAFCHESHATLCPSYDGGYGMLCVPVHAPANVIFSNVIWSHPLTAASQIKVLTDCGIPTRLGRIMLDIDEPQDVRKLWNQIELVRLQDEDVDDKRDWKVENLKSLEISSSRTLPIRNSDFPRTKQVLLELKEFIVNSS